MQTERVKEKQVPAHKAYQAWDVYLHGRWIDTVFYDTNVDAWSVKDELVGHDGYDSGIKVARAR